MTPPRLAVLGAGGRVGTLLRRSGALPGALWFSRRGAEEVEPWDLLADPAPASLRGAEVMVWLAGPARGAALADHTRLALAAIGAAAGAGIGHVLIASSIAVYGRGDAPWREDAPLRPCTDYGRAKAGMEAAVQDRMPQIGPGGGGIGPTAGGASGPDFGPDCGPYDAPGGPALPATLGEVRPRPGRSAEAALAAQPAPLVRSAPQKGAPPPPGPAGSGRPRICLLRLGNVVGADAVSAAMAAGDQVTLDQCSGGGGPLRSMIGPVTLARVLLALALRAQSGAALPPVLNVAQPGPVAMAALCAAAGRGVIWRRAGPATLPCAVLDLAALQSLLPEPAPAANPAALIAEWHVAGGLA